MHHRRLRGEADSVEVDIELNRERLGSLDMDASSPRNGAQCQPRIEIQTRAQLPVSCG